MMMMMMLLLLWKVHLTENAAQKEARLSELEAELGRSKAACTRLEQVFSLWFSFILLCFPICFVCL